LGGGDKQIGANSKKKGKEDKGGRLQGRQKKKEELKKK